jgi:hypothetical protein
LAAAEAKGERKDPFAFCLMSWHGMAALLRRRVAAATPYQSFS